MIFKFAVFGGLVAFIPGASFILIPLELHIVYKIADKYNSFEFDTNNITGYFNIKIHIV